MNAPAAPRDFVGLKIKLDRPVDRERPCCRNICIIGPGKGPHAGKLHCADCGQDRGWLSKPTAQWIEHVVTRFGAPTTPIIVRKAHTFEEEAPECSNGCSGVVPPPSARSPRQTSRGHLTLRQKATDANHQG